MIFNIFNFLINITKIVFILSILFCALFYYWCTIICQHCGRWISYSL